MLQKSALTILTLFFATFGLYNLNQNNLHLRKAISKFLPILEAYCVEWTVVARYLNSASFAIIKAIFTVMTRVHGNQFL